MNLDQATRWRGWVGAAAAMFCVFFLLSSFDGLVALFRERPNTFMLLPGQSVPVDGALKENPKDLGRLDYSSSSDKIKLSFEAVQSGFWTGGFRWRGRITVSSSAEPGEYRVAVDDFGSSFLKPSSVFQIKVHKDSESLRQSSNSLLRRFFDISPWLVSALCFLLTCLAFGLVFYLSHKREALLAGAGMAEIYRISNVSAGCEVAFGFGAKHGMRHGMCLNLLDKMGVPVGQVHVVQVFETDSIAIAESLREIEHGFIVQRQLNV